MSVHDRRIFRSMTNGLAEDSRNDAIGRPLHQLPGKAPPTQ